MTGLSRRRQLVLLLALVGLVPLASAAAGAVAAPDAAAPLGPASAVPTLTGAAVTGQGEGTILTVTGEAFTPEGRVYLALYDPWGGVLHETRWLTASPAVYGPNGSRDPAAGFSRGGSIREAFAHLCGAMVLVRAYDQATATWSNWLEGDGGCGRRGYPLS